MDALTVKSVDESLAEMSEKLLAGWKMLEMSCPISNFPLIEKDGKVFSVPCQMDVVLPPSTGGSSDSSQKAQTVVPEAQARQVFRLLRLGYQLSDEKCPTSGGPLFVKGSQKYSLNEGRHIGPYTHTAADEVANLETIQNTTSASGIHNQTASTSTTGASATAPPSTQSQAVSTSTVDTQRHSNHAKDVNLDSVELQLLAWDKNKDEWTKRVSGHLLQGWKMLNTACPVTNAVPLMQNKEGKTFSPAINDFVDGLTPPQIIERRRRIITEYIASMNPHWSNSVNALAQKGWTVLKNASDPVVPSVPLMKDIAGDIYSVVLERQVDHKLVDSVSDHNDDLVADVPADDDESSDESDIDAFMKRYEENTVPNDDRDQRDAWSQELSSLMLRGWKMVSDHCPETGAVPLMQERGDTRLYSVATGKYYDEDLNEIVDNPEPKRDSLKTSTAPAPSTTIKNVANNESRNGHNSVQDNSTPSPVTAAKVPSVKVVSAQASNAAHKNVEVLCDPSLLSSYRSAASSALRTITSTISRLESQIEQESNTESLGSLLRCLTSAVGSADALVLSLSK